MTPFEIHLGSGLMLSVWRDPPKLAGLSASAKRKLDNRDIVGTCATWADKTNSELAQMLLKLRGVTRVKLTGTGSAVDVTQNKG